MNEYSKSFCCLQRLSAAGGREARPSYQEQKALAVKHQPNPGNSCGNGNLRSKRGFRRRAPHGPRSCTTTLVPGFLGAFLASTDGPVEQLPADSPSKNSASANVFRVHASRSLTEGRAAPRRGSLPGRWPSTTSSRPLRFLGKQFPLAMHDNSGFFRIGKPPR